MDKMTVLAMLPERFLCRFKCKILYNRGEIVFDLFSTLPCFITDIIDFRYILNKKMKNTTSCRCNFHKNLL